MSHDDQVSVSGTITDVFFHRFVVKGEKGTVLADLTPKGAEKIALKVGDKVTITGEQKPSEIKVSRFTGADGKTVEIERKHDHDHAPADPAAALKRAEKEGYRVLGDPRRKPKHFEILGRGPDGHLAELHIELDGHFRHLKPVDADEPKWREALATETVATA